MRLTLGRWAVVVARFPDGSLSLTPPNDTISRAP